VQLVELQAALPALAAAGIWPIALSYDAPATLAAFARERGITFPLLADEGSVVIRRLGLLNPSYPADHPRHGVAQPATFLLDEAGHVARAIVHASQTVRDVWPTALHEVVRLEAAADAPTARDRAEAVEVSVALDSPRYRPRQRVAVRATIDIAPGAHVYGRPLPSDYIPLTLDVTAPAGVTIEPASFPPPTSLDLPALGGTLPVYAGRVELVAHAIFDELRGDATIAATIQLQVCTETDCFTPRRFAVELPIRYAPPD
jgi:alkyl hydroperoxide reductase subunit AhpC